MIQYRQLVWDVLANGKQKEDRTGVGTLDVFGRQARFDLADGFPLVSAKQTSLKLIAAELLWFLSGSTNNEDLREINGDGKPTIWEEWAAEDGSLGPIYGKQWRSWETSTGVTVDQISRLIHTINNNPDSRRMVVSAWNVGELQDMALAPCHTLFQCDVTEGRLNLQVYQRSCDLFLGVPYNIASYALLVHILARECGLMPGELVWTGGSVHLYKNHIEAAQEMLTRPVLELPKLVMTSSALSNINQYRPEHFKLEGYNPHPPIKVQVAV